jgi:hypothetical protein
MANSLAGNVSYDNMALLEKLHGKSVSGAALVMHKYRIVTPC